MTTTSPQEPIRVTVDDEKVYAAYTTGARWNGFATPSFTRPEAERLVDDLLHGEGGPLAAWYEPALDAYVLVDNPDVVDGDLEDRTLVFEGYDAVVLTPESPVYGTKVKRLYPIGAWYWTWTEAGA